MSSEILVVFTVIATKYKEESATNSIPFNHFTSLKPCCNLLRSHSGLPCRLGEWLVVHIVGQRRHMVVYCTYVLRVVVDAAGRAKAHRVEHCPLRLG